MERLWSTRFVTWCPCSGLSMAGKTSVCWITGLGWGGGSMGPSRKKTKIKRQKDKKVLGVPFTLQLWDTSGQERYKCVASTYYRGAQVMIIAFDVNNIGSFSHVRQWLEDLLGDSDPTAVLLFLVGMKKDLSSPAQYSQMEGDALKLAREISAEYWAVSSLTGENVNQFFFRVASLAFENSILAELENSGSTSQIGQLVRISGGFSNPRRPSKKKQSSCCR